jgi:hypothetical protein
VIQKFPFLDVHILSSASKHPARFVIDFAERGLLLALSYLWML